MLGTIVNSIAIIVGSLIGFFLKGGISEKISKTLINGLALCIFLIGILGAVKVNNIMLVIFSIVIGAIVGEKIDIELQLEKFGVFIESKLKGKGGQVSEGFVTASLLFCVGSMAIIGSLESGLSGNHKTLFAKAILDGVFSVIFTSSLGVGVALSAVSVFVYQGTITLLASSLKVLLTQTVINDITAVGSLLIIGLALNMLGEKKIKIGNLLPSILGPILYQIAMNMFYK